MRNFGLTTRPALGGTEQLDGPRVPNSTRHGNVIQLAAASPCAANLRSAQCAGQERLRTIRNAGGTWPESSRRQQTTPRGLANTPVPSPCGGFSDHDFAALGFVCAFLVGVALALASLFLFSVWLFLT